MTSDYNRPINAGIRLVTMILDYIFMTFIAMIFYMPVLIANFATGFKVTHDEEDAAFMTGPMMYVGLFGFALYFCKDVWNGRSISKRILKLQLVDNNTGEVASPLQCLVRNIFLIIFPIEFIVALANTGRRIGDSVAGTRLVYYDPMIHGTKPQLGKMILSVVIFYGIVFMIPRLLPTMEFTKTNYSKTSYNEAESKALQQSINAAYGKNLTADIRIYDTVLNSNLKYISAVIKLRTNYLEHDGSYRTIHNMVTHLIYQRFPKETFTGQIRYVFREPAHVQSRLTSIGTPQ